MDYDSLQRLFYMMMAYVTTKNIRLSDVATEGPTHHTNDFQEAKEKGSTLQ